LSDLDNALDPLAEVDANAQNGNGGSEKLESSGDSANPRPPISMIEVMAAPDQRGKFSRNKLWISLAAVVFIGICLAIFLARNRHTVPEKWKIEDSRFAVFDDEGKILWKHDYPDKLDSGGYERLHRRSPVWSGDLDSDGKKEIFLGGANNDYKQATLVVLDPETFEGASLEPDLDYQILGFPPGKEKARILFPRT